MKNVWNKIVGFFKGIKNFEWTKERKKKVAAVWDKVTTGILIFLLASPFLILGYIFIWFLST